MRLLVGNLSMKITGPPLITTLSIRHDMRSIVIYNGNLTPNRGRKGSHHPLGAHSV